MATFIIQKDFFLGTYVPKGSGRPTQRVNFKKGDIIVGNIIYKYPLEYRSIAKGPNVLDQFVETQTTLGNVRIPYGFNGVPFLIVIPETMRSIPETIEGNEGPKPKVNPKTTETPAKWFTTKNIVIGVLVIVGIYVFLKWKR